MKQFTLPLFWATLLLAGGCTQSRFVTSFGKRKYMKGYYWDRPRNSKTVYALNKTSAKPNVQNNQATVAQSVSNGPKPMSRVNKVLFLVGVQNKINKTEAANVLSHISLGNFKNIFAKEYSVNNKIHGLQLAKTILITNSQPQAKDNKKSKINGFAILSLVTGILSITILLPGLFVLSPILSIPAIIAGHIAWHKITKYPDKYRGKRKAIAGIIIGTITIIIWIAYISLVSLGGI